MFSGREKFNAVDIFKYAMQFLKHSQPPRIHFFACVRFTHHDRPPSYTSLFSQRLLVDSDQASRRPNKLRGGPYFERFRHLLTIAYISLPVSYTHLRAHETDSYLVC